MSEHADLHARRLNRKRVAAGVVSRIGFTPLLAFCCIRGAGDNFSIQRGRYCGNTGLSNLQTDKSYRTARGDAAERGVVRTSRTRVGRRPGWLVAMICAVGDVLGAGCGVEEGVALGGVAGVG